jgi:hypothetical protein
LEYGIPNSDVIGSAERGQASPGAAYSSGPTSHRFYFREVFADLERDQKFFPENFTGVHGRELLHGFPGHLLFLIIRSQS